MDYYIVEFDFARFADQWVIGDPLDDRGVEINASDFTDAVPYRGRTPKVIPIEHAGREVKFCLGRFDLPVVSKQIANVVRGISGGDVEFFPVEIVAARDSYELMNVVAQADCLDESLSEFTKWTAADKGNGKVGDYRMITKYQIDPSRVGGHHLFRLSRWLVALFVSSDLKVELEKCSDLGVTFEPVT